MTDISFFLNCHVITMIRYFYFLLSFLLYIEFSFCYNNIFQEQNIDGKVEDKNLGKKYKREWDGEPLAELDVASFIQKPDYEADENEFVYLKRRKSTNDYGLSGFNIDGNFKKNELPNYINLGLDSYKYPYDQLYEEPAKKSVYSFDALNKKNAPFRKRNVYKRNEQALHKSEKERSLKHVKFPFFSHDKPDSLSSKKDKKRKLFSFGNTKKKKNMSKVSDLGLEVNVTPNSIFKVNKRSFEEGLCPMCGNKYSRKIDKKHRSTKLIHNSRQYYGNLCKPDTKSNQNPELIKERDDTQLKSRNKRDGDKDNQKQIKQIEELQKKVDGIKISTTQYEIDTTTSTSDSFFSIV